jgi:Flp pilus assembly pilin Flp
MRVQYEFFRAWLLAHVRSERAATLVEYALLVALIAVASIGAIQYMGDRSAAKLSSVGSAIGQP